MPRGIPEHPSDVAHAGKGAIFHCPNCGHGVEQWLPIEPMYDLMSITPLLPIGHDALVAWIGKRKSLFPLRHRVDQNGHRRRVISLSECKLLMQHFIYEPGQRLVTPTDKYKQETGRDRYPDIQPGQKPFDKRRQRAEKRKLSLESKSGS